MLVLYVGAIHIFITSVQASDPPCHDLKWGPWSACSVTCDRGVRHREKLCPSDNLPPDYLQETGTESCGAGNICPQDVTGRSLLVQGHAYASLHDHVIKTTTVYGVTECGLLCTRDLRCRSFNVCADKNKLFCELNNATNEDFEEHFRETISCSYYSAIVRTTF
ncbi:uncharacterized protein LOC144641874 isoform X1 [Oculina patagonica]